MTGSVEPRPEINAGRDSYNAGRDINIITNNYNSSDSRGTADDALQVLDDALQDEDDRADRARRLDLRRFTGRERLIAKIEELTRTSDQGWIVIEGAAGTGKTALAMHLAEVNKTKSWFLHSTSISGGRNAENVRKNLAAQLIRAFGLDERAPDSRKGADADYLAKVIRSAAKARTDAERQPIVLVIDSLNEIRFPGYSENPGELPEADVLPYKVFVVATRRPAPEPSSFGSPCYLATIETGQIREIGAHHSLYPGDNSNERDMREYLTDLLDGPHPDQGIVRKLRTHNVSPAEFINTLVPRAAGLWLYLRYVLDTVRVEERHPVEIIRSLPPRLHAIYLEEVSKQRELDPVKWERICLPALATLAAMRRPVTRKDLASYAGIREDDYRALANWLDKDVRPLLDVVRDPATREISYEVRHQSLREFVADPETDDYLDSELRDAWLRAHARITKRLTPLGAPGLRDWASADPYVRDMLAEHAANGQRLVGHLLDDLVNDPGFLLICQSSSVLLRRRDLTAPGILAVSAYEEALNEWAGLQPDDGDERAWRLHVWARKTGASELAVAAAKIAGRKIAGRTVEIKAAAWTGTTHRLMQHARIGSVNAITTVQGRNGRPLLASSGSDGRVRFWDPASGTSDGSALDGDATGVMAAAAVPLSGQQILLATGDRSGVLQLWDPVKRVPAGEPIHAHLGAVNAITVVVAADDHTLLVTCGRDRQVRLWDPSTGAPAGARLTGHADWVTAAAAVPVSGMQLLATGSRDGTIRLWDPQTGLPLGDPMTCGNRGVNAIAAVTLGGDSAMLAAGGADGTVQFWDPQTMLPLGDLRTRSAAHAGAVSAITVAWLPDRPLFASVGEDRTIRMWDPVTGEAEPVSFKTHANLVKAIAAVSLRDGRTLLAAGGNDGKVELQELYESETGAPADAAKAGHSRAVTAIAAARHAGRRVIVSGSRDRTARIWDPETGAPIGEPLTGHDRPLSAVVPIPLAKEHLIATSDVDGVVRLWDLTKTPPKSRRLKSDGKVYAIAPVRLPGGNLLLATGGSQWSVRLWDPVSGEPVGVPMTGHTEPVNAITSVQVADGSTVLASGASDGTVRRWDPVGYAAIGDPLTGYGEKIRSVAAMRLPGGRMLLAAGSEHGKVYVWDGDERIAVLEPSPRQASAVTTLAAVELPGRTLLAAGGDRVVRLWNPVTDEPVGSLTGHSLPVNGIAALPGDPTLLVTVSDDRTILIWTFGDSQP